MSSSFASAMPKSIAYASAWNAPDGISEIAMDPDLVSTVNHEGTETRGFTSLAASARETPRSKHRTRSHLMTSHSETAPSASAARMRVLSDV